MSHILIAGVFYPCTLSGRRPLVRGLFLSAKFRHFVVLPMEFFVHSAEKCADLDWVAEAERPTAALGPGFRLAGMLTALSKHVRVRHASGIGTVSGMPPGLNFKKSLLDWKRVVLQRNRE